MTTHSFKEVKMKTHLLLLVSLLTIFSASAQDITGKWNGLLNIQGTELRLTFNMTQNSDGYSTTMDSPDQGATNIPIAHTTFENPFIKFEDPRLGITYNGELKDDEIIGTFRQNGQEFSLNLSKKEVQKTTVNRPQEPVEPYPYYSEPLTFENKSAGIKLAGTLTLPQKEGSFPAVILISGSGPQNRDEELMGHKPFLVLSDYLTRNGIAVLRYDDRGLGESEGDFSTATSADFANDVESAVAYLKTRKEIDATKIGLVGHSEGGLIAPIVASKSDDVSFIVLLAGSGIRGDKLLLLQEELIERAFGTSEEEISKLLTTNSKIFDLVINSTDDTQLKLDLRNLLSESIKDDTTQVPNGMTSEEYISSQVNQFTSPWVRYFLKYDPAVTLEKVKCPVLAVNGEKDLQVPPKENLTAIKNALLKGGNKNVNTIEFPGLNHLFQEADTGSPLEYSRIEQTFSPVALEEVTKWIKSHVE